MRSYLKELREQNGLTIARMAEKLDISESYYSLIESGQRQRIMDLTLALKLAKILGVSLEVIVHGEKEID